MILLRMETTSKEIKSDISCENNLHHSRFMTILSILQLGGISLYDKSQSKLNILYNVLCVVCAYITLSCAIMDTYVHRHDLVLAMKKMRVILAMSLSIWIHFSISYCKRDIEHLLNLTDSFTWEELQTRNPDTGILTKAGYIPIIQNRTKFLVKLGTSFHVIQSAVRIVFYHDMMFTSWFPLDISTAPVYVLSNTIQGIASFFAITTSIGFPSLYATVVCVACSQLDKLGAALLCIRQTRVTSDRRYGDKTDYQRSERQVHTSAKLFRRMQEQLNECIRHHQDIKRYMAMLEDTMNFPLCGLFFLLLSTMCLDALSFVTGLGDYADGSQALVLYILVTSSLCIFSWLGNELSTYAERVSDAAWGCDWVGTPVPFQRSLVFIIATANKEFTLTAGKFVPVSNSTMMNMMNQSISFFMFLLHVKNKITDSNETAQYTG